MKSVLAQMSTEDVLFGFVVWLVVYKKQVPSKETDCYDILALVDEFCQSHQARADWANIPLYQYNKVGEVET